MGLSRRRWSPLESGPPGPSTAAVIGPPLPHMVPSPETLHALVIPTGYGLQAVYQCILRQAITASSLFREWCAVESVYLFHEAMRFFNVTFTISY